MVDDPALLVCTFCIDSIMATAESPRFMMLSSNATFSSNDPILELVELTNLSAVLRAAHNWNIEKDI